MELLRLTSNNRLAVPRNCTLLKYGSPIGLPRRRQTLCSANANGDARNKHNGMSSLPGKPSEHGTLLRGVLGVLMATGSTAMLAVLAAASQRSRTEGHLLHQSLPVTAQSYIAVQHSMVSPHAVSHPIPLASVSASNFLQHHSTNFYETLAYLNYKVLQAMTLPTWGKVLTVLAVAAPILAVGSVALCACTGLSPGAAMLRCYYILNNVPGVDITTEENPRALFVLNLVYAVGLLTFAVLIGVLGDDIGSAVEAARLGNSRVPERNHTVVLGHNRQLVEVLRQVANVRRDRGTATFPGQLVVLSELERETLDRILLEALGPAAASQVVTRQGSPLKVADLQRVSAGHARTVIVLAAETKGDEAGGGGAAAADDGGDAAAEGAEEGVVHALTLEAQQAVTLAALHHLRRQALAAPGGSGLGVASQTVVLQHDADLGLLDAGLYGGAATGGAGAVGGAASNPVRRMETSAFGTHLVTRVSHLNSLSRIHAQCASEPGLSTVLSSLLQQQPGMPEFYIQSVPELVGLTYGEARRRFPRAVLCGVYDPSASASAMATTTEECMDGEARLEAEASAVVLNPPESLTLLERYSLILLADSASDLRTGPTATPSKTHPSSDHASASLRNVTTTSPGSTASGPATSASAALGPSAPAQQPQPRNQAELGAPRMRVVVLAFDGRQPEDLLDGLEDYCAPGSEAMVVAAEGTEASWGLKRSTQQQRHLRVNTVVGDPRTRGSLQAAAAMEADSVIIAGLDDAPSAQADAQALATLLQLQAIMPVAKPSPGLPHLRHPGASNSGLSHNAGPSGKATTDHPAATVTNIASKSRFAAAFTAAHSPSESPAATTCKDTSTACNVNTSSTSHAPFSSSFWLRPLNLVCSVTDPKVRDIMNSLVEVQRQGSAAAAFGGGTGGGWRRPVSLDLINSDELLAGVLTQVAAEPRLSGLFHELSTTEGMEVHLRSAGSLGLPCRVPLSWEKIQDAGRANDVTVIGILRNRPHDGHGSSQPSSGSATATASGRVGGTRPHPTFHSGLSADHKLLLGVPPAIEMSLELWPDDRMVVISQD